MMLRVKKSDNTADFDDDTDLFHIVGENGDDCRVYEIEEEEELLVQERGEKVFLSRSQLRRLKRDKLKKTLRKDVCWVVFKGEPRRSANPFK